MELKLKEGKSRGLQRSQGKRPRHEPEPYTLEGECAHVASVTLQTEDSVA